MKNFKLKIILVICILVFMMTGAAITRPIDDLNIDIGGQYRVMFNYSDIGSRNDYDFIRQRMRLSFNIEPVENVGGYIQLEYRGGWGGSSPAASDPRGNSAVNPFNRLQARGVRYGYIYYKNPRYGLHLRTGILPVSDKFDDTLFSADWDFNVGGATLEKNFFDKVDVRVGYIRMIDDLTSLNSDTDSHFAILDAVGHLENWDIGGHMYYLNIEDTDAGNVLPRSHQLWYGATVKGSFDWSVFNSKLKAFALFNDGKVAGLSNSGNAFKGELTTTVLDKHKFSILGLFSSGSSDTVIYGNELKRGFHTPQGIFGTAGYWGYTYIFTPHGPSDVNDYGLEIGNRGYGLTTFQGKYNVDIIPRLSLEIVAGLFNSEKSIGGSGTRLGSEIGATLAVKPKPYLVWELGGSSASVGGAGRSLYQGVNNGKSVIEIFSRFQLEF